MFSKLTGARCLGVVLGVVLAIASLPARPVTAYWAYPQEAPHELHITVWNADHQPVSGMQVTARVYVPREGETGEGGSCVTDGTGECTIVLETATKNARGFISARITIGGAGETEEVWRGGRLDCFYTLTPDGKLFKVWEILNPDDPIAGFVGWATIQARTPTVEAAQESTVVEHEMEIAREAEESGSGVLTVIVLSVAIVFLIAGGVLWVVGERRQKTHDRS